MIGCRFSYKPHDHHLAPPRKEFSRDDLEGEQEQQVSFDHQDAEYQWHPENASETSLLAGPFGAHLNTTLQNNWFHENSDPDADFLTAKVKQLDTFFYRGGKKKEEDQIWDKEANRLGNSQLLNKFDEFQLYLKCENQIINFQKIKINRLWLKIDPISLANYPKYWPTAKEKEVISSRMKPEGSYSMSINCIPDYAEKS